MSLPDKAPDCSEDQVEDSRERRSSGGNLFDVTIVTASYQLVIEQDPSLVPWSENGIPVGRCEYEIEESCIHEVVCLGICQECFCCTCSSASI